MSLKDMIQKHRARETAPLIPMIDRRMMARALDPKSKFDFENRYVISPSRISKGMCARFEQLAEAFGTEKDPVEPGLQRKYEAGTVTHRWYQNEVFGPLGVLYGRWVNLASIGNRDGSVRPRSEWEVTEGFMPEPEVWIQPMNIPKWFYVEPAIELPQYRVGGHTDGLIIDGSTRMLIEIKTSNERLYVARRQPDAEHRAQVSLYLSGTMTSHKVEKYRKADVGIVLYHNKNSQDEVEFTVPAPEVPDWVPGEYSRLTAAEAEGRLAERIDACGSKITKRATGCAQCHRCFGARVDVEYQRKLAAKNEHLQVTQVWS